MSTTASKVGGVGRRRVAPNLKTYSGRLAARVRELREKKKMPVPELADIIGVASATLYQYETGRREIPVSVAVAIGAALGCKNAGDIFPKA